MKSYRIIITPTAENCLLEIGEYIALDNPERAITFLTEITDSLRQTLSMFPYSGKVAEDLELDEEVRVMPYGNYNSYYRVKEEEELVEVLFVFNASRHVRGLLSAI